MTKCILADGKKCNLMWQEYQQIFFKNGKELIFSRPQNKRGKKTGKV